MVSERYKENIYQSAQDYLRQVSEDVYTAKKNEMLSKKIQQDVAGSLKSEEPKDIINKRRKEWYQKAREVLKLLTWDDKYHSAVVKNKEGFTVVKKLHEEAWYTRDEAMEIVFNKELVKEIEEPDVVRETVKNIQEYIHDNFYAPESYTRIFNKAEVLKKWGSIKYIQIDWKRYLRHPETDTKILLEKFKVFEDGEESKEWKFWIREKDISRSGAKYKSMAYNPKNIPDAHYIVWEVLFADPGSEEREWFKNQLQYIYGQGYKIDYKGRKCKEMMKKICPEINEEKSQVLLFELLTWQVWRFLQQNEKFEIVYNSKEEVDIKNENKLWETKRMYPTTMQPYKHRGAFCSNYQVKYFSFLLIKR